MAPRDFGISYASEDSKFAKELAEALRGRGCSVLLYSSSEGVDQVAGTDLHELPKRFDDALIFVPVLSKDYFSKKWPLAELGHALSQSTSRVLPVVLDSAPPLDSMSNGLLPTLAYLDHSKLPTIDIAVSLVRKLHAIQSEKEQNRRTRRFALMLFAFMLGVTVAAFGTVSYQNRRDAVYTDFWTSLVSDPCTIVIGSYYDESLRFFEASQLLGIGDAMALSLILQSQPVVESELVELRPSAQIAGIDRGERLGQNLILIGGPDVNKTTRYVLGLLDTNLRFGDPDKHEIFIKDRTDGATFAPLVSQTRGVVQDYGILVRARNPINPQRDVLIVAGSYGWGTYAATSLVAKKDLIRRLFPDGQVANIEAVVKTEIANDWAQPPTIERVHRLDVLSPK